MKKIQKEGVLSITVKQDATDELYRHFDEIHKHTVWQEECRSWYKNGKLRNRIYLWPGPVSLSENRHHQPANLSKTIHYLKTIKEPRAEDYDFKYRYGNRFAFLGNGTVKAMVTKDIDGLSTYVRSSDTAWDIE